ncbi:recombinase family protein [Chitinimonas arctica]|uniref:recombinase family protein n=1 Tax=Chitinimonas arctica TaxID=2594795 RepID=UPI0021E02978|nr:recombinase family protein [Chitinimonas arctica]
MRFSDSRQASGNSADRQILYATKWATERNLLLDESLSLRDEGLSAFHQKHVSQGAFGTFLAAVDEGRIARGSCLVVEGLDRLSRAEPLLAQAQLTQIINAGITVVTASDGKEYNRERLIEQPMDLVYSLLVMIRAHEESATKSKRVKAAIHKQCELWEAGLWRGRIRNGGDPGWLKWTGKEWALVSDRAEAVRFAYLTFLQGHGALYIVRALSEQKLSISGRANVSTSHLYRVLRMRALVGDKILRVDGKEYRLKGYYPAVLSELEFEELQQVISRRARQVGKGEIPSVITGVGMTYCGYCGASVASQNITSRKKTPESLVRDCYRRLICTGISEGQGCSGGTVSVAPIEKALMNYCSDQINLNSLLSGNQAVEASNLRLMQSRQKVEALLNQIERITTAIVEAEGEGIPSSFLRKARELEAELEKEKKQEQLAENEVSALSNQAIPAYADAWAELADGVLGQDYDARMKARRLVIETFERIVIYASGLQLEVGHQRPVDVLLVVKGGRTRLLRIDRRTGAWKATIDVFPNALTVRMPLVHEIA